MFNGEDLNDEFEEFLGKQGMDAQNRFYVQLSESKDNDLSDLGENKQAKNREHHCGSTKKRTESEA